MKWNEWKSHETDSIKTILVLGFIVLCGAFIATRPFFRDNLLTGLVNPNDAVHVNVVLSSIPGATQVQKGLYGVGVAKMYDEMALAPNWLSTATTLMDDLAPDNVRYPAGGVVKYSHVFTTHMSQPLTEEEQATVVDVGAGPELRGLGNIIADREDEEALGNTGELAEITEPKNIYGGQSYLDGFQSVQPHNFIHDMVDLTDTSGANMIYVINITYATPEEIRDQVSFLKNNGVNIKGYECGNETYAKRQQFWAPGDPNVMAPEGVSAYLNLCDTYKNALLAVDPLAGSKFAVAAAPDKNFAETEDGFDSDEDFNSAWNTALASQMGAHGYNNYILHFYHPFYTCGDAIAGGQRDPIFSCGRDEMGVFGNTSLPENTLMTSLPPILDHYASTFPGKKMWLTEWNINQDPSRTDSKFANSMLHAIFTEEFLNILNQSNVLHNNFITYADYHTFATDGGNAMINNRVVKTGIAEPTDIDMFVRRTPYYAFLSMQNIFKDGYTPMTATFTLTGDADPEDVSFHAYKGTDGKIALAMSNMSTKTIIVDTISVDGQDMDMTATTASFYGLDGDTNYASRGKTSFSVNPGHEVTIRNESYTNLTYVYLPGFGTGTLTMTPVYIIPEPEIVDDTNTDTGDTPTSTSGVGQDGKAPKVRITSPTPGETLSGNMSILAEAKDNVGVSYVEFYVSPLGLIGKDDSAPYKIPWDTSTLQPGRYRLYAKAYDAVGNSGVSEEVMLMKK